MDTGKPIPKNSQLIGSEVVPAFLGTPWRLTLEPENQPLEKEIPIGNHHFEVPAVKLWGCTLQNVSTDPRFLAWQREGLEFESLKIQM